MPPAPGTAEPPLTIGWKEYLDLPGLGIAGIKAKVDTGARTSALHVADLEVLERHADGTAEVTFQVPLDRRRPERRVSCRATLLREIRVTDSGGTPEIRPLVETELSLGGVRKPILLTLTDRSGMLFRMLLGRKALEGDFVVDVSKKYLTTGGRPPRRSGETP